MRTVTMLEKCYGPYLHRGLEKISRHLKILCEGLDVRVHSVEYNARGWIKAVVSGEDEEVVVSHLDKEFGLALGAIDSVVIGESLRGKIIDSGFVGYGLYVDLGISHPEKIDALIPLHELRTQLVRDRRTSLREIIHTFCLFDNLTLEIVPTMVDRDKSIIEAHLSNPQLSTLRNWEEVNLERIITMGATSRQVKNSVVRSGHKRDVLRVEDLGLLESAVICKLGTHAKGLIPKLGRFLRGVPMHIFLPKKVRRLFGIERISLESRDTSQ